MAIWRRKRSHAVPWQLVPHKLSENSRERSLSIRLCTLRSDTQLRNSPRFGEANARFVAFRKRRSPHVVQ